MRTYLVGIVAVSIASLAACGGSSEDDGAGGAGATDSAGSGDPGTFANGSGGNGGSGSGSGASSSSGCKRVDLVIAVDNSGSMKEEKDAMANVVFPAFATQLLAIGGGLEDYRVGVLDACPDPANYHTRGVAGECNFSSGEVWMVSSSPALTDEFKCVGDIFSGDMNCAGDNDDEQPANAAATSMEPPYSDGPNAGFLRDDALLVVIAITDEDEQPVPDANAQAVYDRLVKIKGDVSKMVFLGIGGSQSCDGVYGSAKDAAVLEEITDLFIAQNRGVWWDLCGGALEQGLGKAMDVIEQACGEFPTPK